MISEIPNFSVSTLGFSEADAMLEENGCIPFHDTLYHSKLFYILFMSWGLGLLCLTLVTLIFQLYRGGYFVYVLS